MSCFGPGLHRSLQCKRPSKGQVLTTTRAASQIMFFIYRYDYEWRQIYRESWCAFTCGRFGAVNERKKGRERAREREWGSGEVQGRFFASSLTLQESQIASGSRYPPLQNSVFVPFPPPCCHPSFLPFILSSVLWFYSCFWSFLILCLYSGSQVIGLVAWHGTGWQCL